MLTLGNMMSLLTKGKVKLNDQVGRIAYKQFKKVINSLKQTNKAAIPIKTVMCAQRKKD
jgi:hypothetical protein